MNSIRRRTAITTALPMTLLWLATLLAAPAAAHTEVLRASPGPAEKVSGVVDRVELTFLDPVLDPVTIVVTGPDGGEVAGLGEATLGTSNRSASASFDPLSTEGGYVVEYEFSAPDGDTQRETFRFEFTPTGPSTSADGAAPPAADAVDDDGPTVGSVLGVVAVLLTVIVGAAVAVRRREK